MRRYKIIYAEGMNYVKAEEEGKLKEKTVEASSVTVAPVRKSGAWEPGRRGGLSASHVLATIINPDNAAGKPRPTPGRAHDVNLLCCINFENTDHAAACTACQQVGRTRPRALAYSAGRNSGCAMDGERARRKSGGRACSVAGRSSVMHRKIMAMYDMFGRVKNVCGNCCHLKGDKGEYRKCEVYGISHSAATDWALGWQACGAFNLISVRERNLYKSLPRKIEFHDEPLEGQMEMHLESQDG